MIIVSEFKGGFLTYSVLSQLLFCMFCLCTRKVTDKFSLSIRMSRPHVMKETFKLFGCFFIYVQKL